MNARLLINVYREMIWFNTFIDFVYVTWWSASTESYGCRISHLKRVQCIVHLWMRQQVNALGAAVYMYSRVLARACNQVVPLLWRLASSSGVCYCFYELKGLAKQNGTSGETRNQAEGQRNLERCRVVARKLWEGKQYKEAWNHQTAFRCART